MQTHILNTPRRIPWSMERDVADVLLEGVTSAERINLYWFLRPVCPGLTVELARFTLCDFVRNPRHCIPEANVCDAVWQYLPYLLWKFRQCDTPLVRHFGPPGNWKPAQWASWQIYINMDDTPLEAIDEEIWCRCRRPPPVPQCQPYQGVVWVGATASFVQVPYPTVGYLVHIPISPRPWRGL
ncbi:VSG-associated, congolense-specific ORF [Trypanosoma congolense IL3000]|uniref:VSG-associated, congolense-specific ORF n=1 Tax=Trypanosoma congolense (strain IL3000) TaxID=1068625 RepID=F9WG92_TRYCI|nr:VSG-associated, congolense-specific ORF [Trypanosoma congolense IL3000]